MKDKIHMLLYHNRQAIVIEHASAHIDIKDLEIEVTPEAAMNSIIEAFTNWLAAAGCETEWDGPEHL